MAVVLLHHHGRRIATSGWTAAETPDGRTEICYLRPGNAGAAKAVIDMRFRDFTAMVAEGPVTDLTRRLEPAG